LCFFSFTSFIVIVSLNFISCNLVVELDSLVVEELDEELEELEELDELEEELEELEFVVVDEDVLLE